MFLVLKSSVKPTACSLGHLQTLQVFHSLSDFFTFSRLWTLTVSIATTGVSKAAALTLERICWQASTGYWMTSPAGYSQQTDGNRDKCTLPLLCKCIAGDLDFISRPLRWLGLPLTQDEANVPDQNLGQGLFLLNMVLG